MSATKKKAKSTNFKDYHHFSSINGNHTIKNSIPNSHVDYLARKRKGGKVLYFNFELAKEIGLIPHTHPNKLNPELIKTVLDTFSLVIINEYDIIHQTQIEKKEIFDNKYMATRYLQLQHPSKKGETSGDGRSIWNGEVKINGSSWDFSSCGTGVTRLCPATANQNKFFKTGNRSSSYGCGHADLSDGIAGAMMSEIFYNEDLKTERTMAIIEYERGTSINVRAYKNLLRPSHFFLHLKQDNFEGLKSSVDYYIEKQISNKEWPQINSKHKRYDYFLKSLLKTFSELVARFETDYIFCWLDWDGDNILVDGGIIDYGSVRKFGLYHHEYRYDDVERYSTNIPEQKKKARYIFQTFIQLIDYLKTGEKKNLKKYSKHKLLKDFDNRYVEHKKKLILKKIGLTDKQINKLHTDNIKDVDQFIKYYSYFERKMSKKGQYNISDGITRDAIYCLRDILRELPVYLHQFSSMMPIKLFHNCILSTYAGPKDRRITPYIKQKIQRFQKSYLDLITKLSSKNKFPNSKLLQGICFRSSIINKYSQITGDAILAVTNYLMWHRKNVKQEDIQKIMEDFVKHQVLFPLEKDQGKDKEKNQKIINQMLKIVKDRREGL